MGGCASGPRMVDSSHLEEVNAGDCLASGSNATIPTTTERNLCTSPYSSGTTTTEGKTSATSMRSSIMQSSTCSEDLEYLAFPNGRILPLPKLKVFKFVELEIATKNFKAENLLGEGGFGKVYKGWVNETTLAPSKSGHGKAVAVKKLNSESVQGWLEWKSEVDFLGRLSHPNLVKLLGYCSEGQELLLVYEFMAKGSLENHLFRRSSASYVLNWNHRLKIATDAARALAFLHSSDDKIIYRDFKASNVLLDSNYNAKIADFGLAKEGPVTGETHVSTRVMGTYGYVAPEYATTGHLYVKSDVYGFGVVLLELLSSQRTLDLKRMAEQRNFVIWARPLLHDRKSFIRVMDPQLDGQYPSKVAFETCRLASWCLAFEPENRPSMNDVVERLESIEAMKGETDEVRVRPPQPGARNPSGMPTQHQFSHHP